MEFEYRLLTNREGPLAKCEVTDITQLNSYMEVLHGDFQLLSAMPTPPPKACSHPKAWPTMSARTPGSSLMFNRTMISASACLLYTSRCV